MTDNARRAPARDVEEVLRLHREWWEANVDLDIDRMAKVFPSPGDGYLMFNFNGHPYYGMAEKVALWEHYRTQITLTDGLDVRIMRLEIHGDMAWLACEAYLGDSAEIDSPDLWSTDGLDDPPWCRSTEIYQRNDGRGRPEWRMWHTHVSPLPHPREIRPGFDDTYETRGVGYVPWEPLPARDAS